MGKDPDQLRHDKHHQRHDYRHRHTEQDEGIDHRHFQFLLGVLALFAVVRQLLQHRAQVTGRFTRLHHGAVHLIENVWKLAHGVGQGMSLRDP